MKNNIRMKVYNWYIIKDIWCDGRDGEEYIVQYYGREEGFPCMICDHGNNAMCFNRYYAEDQWETWCYGKEHFPKIIKDLGKSDEQIIDNEENLNRYLKEED